VVLKAIPRKKAIPPRKIAFVQLQVPNYQSLHMTRPTDVFQSAWQLFFSVNALGF